MTAFFLALAFLAAPPDPAVFFTELFAGRVDPRRAFAPSFLAAVPAEKIAEIPRMYVEALGPFRRAHVAGGKGSLEFERGDAPCTIHFDREARVDGLWFGAMNRRDDSVRTILDAFTALPGTVSVLLLRDGSAEVAALAPDLPLAVGSAFKLFVLKALRAAQRGGRLAEDAVVPLRAADVSLPTGILQSWPDGTPVTVASLATLMISLSDNTATDRMIALLGREAVEAAAPARLRPFLTTREMFCFKLGTDAAGLRDRYLAADEAGRRALLAGIAGRRPPLEDAAAWTDPVAIGEIEWHATARELAETIAGLGADPALVVNPGLARAGEWECSAYKGGAEPGVLNYTHLLRARPGGPLYALSTTINDARRPVEGERFSALVARLMDLVRLGKTDGAGGR